MEVANPEVDRAHIRYPWFEGKAVASQPSYPAHFFVSIPSCTHAPYVIHPPVWHTHLNPRQQVAPRKWTSDDEETWLSAWYPTYQENLTNKKKNYNVFFADLFEQWFERFPVREKRFPGISADELTADQKTQLARYVQQRKDVRIHFYLQVPRVMLLTHQTANSPPVQKPVFKYEVRSPGPRQCIKHLESSR